MTKPPKETFEEAFLDGTAGCRIRCHCGQVFYDDVQPGDWQEGELEELRADPRAVSLPHSPSNLYFERTLYVVDCSCWHERARQICDFLDRHARQIATYLNLERRRKIDEAEAMPVVEEED